MRRTEGIEEKSVATVDRGRVARRRGANRERADRRFAMGALAPAWLFLVVLIGYPLLMVVLDSFVHDIFERIASESGRLARYNKRRR